MAETDRQRLLEIANKCPIHKLLNGQVLIQSELADGATISELLRC